MRQATAAELHTVMQDRYAELHDLITSHSVLRIHGNGSGESVVIVHPIATYTVEMMVDDEIVEIAVQGAPTTLLQAGVIAEIQRSRHLQTVVDELLKQVKSLRTAPIGCFAGACQRFSS